MTQLKLVAALFLIIQIGFTSLPAHAQWTVTNLHPGGAGSSFSNAGNGNQQVGIIFEGSSQGALWTGTSDSIVVLTPDGAWQSIASGVEGGFQFGSSRFGNQWRATMWNGTAESAVDLHVGDEVRDSTFINGAGDGQQVGRLSVPGNDFASLWTGTADSWVNLNPEGGSFGIARDAGGGQQVGNIFKDSVFRASLWRGTAESWVDLHPAGSTTSAANATDGFNQAGQARFNGLDRAGMWSGTADSWTDLNPLGATESLAEDIDGEWQVGLAVVGGVARASLWNGSADSWEDLTLALDGIPSRSRAKSVWIHDDQLFVLGEIRNDVVGREEVVLWSRPLSSVPEPGSAGILALASATFLMCHRRR